MSRDLEMHGIVGGIGGDALAGDILLNKTAYVKGKKITGIIPTKPSQTYIPSIANQTIAAGQYLSGVQTILGDADLIASNIKNGVNIFGVSGNYTAKRYAIGQTQADSYGNFTVSGLAFQPKCIIFKDSNYPSLNTGGAFADKSIWGLTNDVKLTVDQNGSRTPSIIINAYGFSVTYGSGMAYATIYWIAFE